MDAFSGMKTSAYVVRPMRVTELLDELVRADKGKLALDNYVKSYYGNHHPMLWVSYLGVDSRADSLIACLAEVEHSGLSPRMFRRNELENDIKRLRTLDLDSADNDINHVAARLEYNLTRAFVRYCTVQHYGFLNPANVLNRLCVKDSDSLHVVYHRVFDIPFSRPGEDFFQQALGQVQEHVRDGQAGVSLYDGLALVLKAVDVV